ncbi:MAG TPA: DNA polymerase III subunit beta [Terriglobia bacterium]|nr:DNA polymerase III subunit beta [Terriglobia bacterium]
MEFTVRKFDLLQELTLIQGVVERKTTIPILANVLLHAEGGELRVTATDLETGLKSVCVSKTTVPGTITLPAKRLFEIVRALPDKEIKFKRGEANWVSVTCGASRFRIAGLPQEDFPALPEAKPSTGRIPADVLAKLITRTIFAISTEDSKYTLSGALLLLKPGSITMVATDGHRLAHVEKSEELEEVREEIKVLIPKKAMAELVRIIAESPDADRVGFSRDDNHLFFDMGKRLLISRMLTGQFPNYEAVLPRGNDRSVTVNREEMAAAIKRVAILSDERSRTVKLALGNGSLEITASHSDLGEAHETLEVDYSKEELQVGFNYQYLLDFLTTADEPEVSFEFKDSESAAQLRVQPSTDYNYRYVVMPMRI